MPYSPYQLNNSSVSQMSNWGTPNGVMPNAGGPAASLIPQVNAMPVDSNPYGLTASGVNNLAPNAIANSGSSWLDGMVGTTKTPGWGGLALGSAGGIANAYFGMQQLDLAKQTLDQNKKQFELNYGAQRSTTNTNLRDRQAARVASNSGAYQSVGDYMNQNGIA